ncbi:hypothetical protein [Synechococcus sp. C9]|uniref:hypothetical protein n=1 Tax=Synechococcus sp. C9 TaxID=102119 RepID=UPI0030D82F1B
MPENSLESESGGSGGIMDKQELQQKVKAIQSKREVLVQLLSQPELGTLRIDVTQALEEMDDLLAEFAQVFPGTLT